MDIKKLKTLAGLSLDEVATRLDQELPKDAYKAVPGAAGLTDIDPNYMRKILNETFGLCGVGWGYKYEPVDMHVAVENRPRSSGGTRTVHTASLKRLTFWYRLARGDEGDATICEIDASGGSENDVEAYAMKGAITNALGNAVSNIGFQESVYLGKRSHKTVGSTAKQTATAAAKAKASVTKAKTAKAAPAPATPVANDDPAVFVVPVGKRAGKTLADVYAEGEDGIAAIHFYTTMPSSGNAQKEALKNAAIAFMAKNNGHVPQSVAA